MHPHIVWNYYTDLDGRMVGKRLHNGYTFFFNNGGYTELSWNPEFSAITAPLRLASNVRPIAPGDYAWNEWQLRFSSDPSRAAVVLLHRHRRRALERPAAHGDDRPDVAPDLPAPRDLGLKRTSADLDAPGTDFVTAVWTARANYSFSTNMFVDSLLQYDQDRDRFNANLRFNFIHRPLSDLFVVFNEQRITNDPAIAPGRGHVVKFTRMMAF